MARVLIRPIQPLELEFADGTIKEALFNTDAFTIYTNEFGRLDAETLNELKNKPYDMVARFLYCGMKVIDTNVTLDEAKAITIGGGEALSVEVLNATVENFMLVADEESKKKFLVTMEEFNKALME